MSFWIFIWILVSGALIYFTVWSAWIILKQKQSWQGFAKRFNLRYEAAGLFTSPKLSGVYKDYTVALFPCQHQTPDARGVRKLTAIEVDVVSKMPIDGAVASGGMISVVEDLNFAEEYGPPAEWWDGAALIRTDHKAALEAYLTPARLKALTALIKIKNAWLIFIFKGGRTILRVDTPDPLDSQKKIGLILHKMIEVAKVLELADAEEQALAAHAAQ